MNQEQQELFGEILREQEYRPKRDKNESRKLALACRAVLEEAGGATWYADFHKPLAEYFCNGIESGEFLQTRKDDAVLKICRRMLVDQDPEWFEHPTYGHWMARQLLNKAKNSLDSIRPNDLFYVGDLKDIVSEALGTEQDKIIGVHARFSPELEKITKQGYGRAYLAEPKTAERFSNAVRQLLPVRTYNFVEQAPRGEVFVQYRDIIRFSPVAYTSPNKAMSFLKGHIDGSITRDGSYVDVNITPAQPKLRLGQNDTKI